jgi:hypothetical protein
MKHSKAFFFFFFISINFNLSAMLAEYLQQKWLYEAVENDNEQETEGLLLTEIDPNKSLAAFKDMNPIYEHSPTYIAITHKKAGALAALLRHGGNPNTIVSQYCSTFSYALKSGNAACLDLLLKYKVKTMFSDLPSTKHANKVSICNKAINTKDPEIIKVLIKHRYITGIDVTAEILPKKQEEASEWERHEGSLIDVPEIEEILLALRKKWRQKEIAKIQEAQRKRPKRKTPDDEQKEICIFCQDDLITVGEDDLIIEKINTEEFFDCSHNKHFHESCIQAWKTSRQRFFKEFYCPVCREKPPRKKPRIMSIATGLPTETGQSTLTRVSLHDHGYSHIS